MATAREGGGSVLDPATTEHLRGSMRATYFRLRLGMVVLSFVFPLIFYVYWITVGAGPRHLQLESISAFYGAGDIARDLFVAILWAIGSFLVGYKGVTVYEDWLLNSAGVCAALVGVIPCRCWEAGAEHSAWHTRFAVSFFVLMAIVMLFFSRKTLNLLDERWKKIFRWAYVANSAAFVLSIAAVITLNELLPNYTAYIFRIEWLGIWSFSAYWALKTWEYSKTDFERKVSRGEVQYRHKVGVVPGPAAPASGPIQPQG